MVIIVITLILFVVIIMIIMVLIENQWLDRSMNLIQKIWVLCHCIKCLAETQPAVMSENGNDVEYRIFLYTE
jgi:hypothetical protein